MSGSSERDVGEEARKAIDVFIGRSLVFFVWGRASNAMPRWVASGILFATRAGRGVVLTAKHNVKDAIKGEPIRLGYCNSDDVLDDVVAGIVQHDSDDVDLAAIALKPRPTEALAGLALDVGALAADDQVQAERDALILAGFPSALRHTIEQQRPGKGPLRYIGFRSVTHGTGLQDPPTDERGRFRMEWIERELPGGATEPMPEPEGISGGALWRFRRRNPGELWSPPGLGSIIGVPVAFWRPTGTEFAEPISKWRTWFLATLDLIDRDLPWADPR